MWPDFDGADLARALKDFHGRERRFGALPASTMQPLAGRI
jgi:undecaprenyl diphosphate synthase